VSAGASGAQKELGRVGGRCGRGSQRRARVRARWSTAGAGKAELTAQAHGTEREREREREREDGRAGVTARRLAKRAHKAEREEGRASEETGADSLAPLGRERVREGTRERGLPLTGGTHLSGGTGARPG
jgi:hypothetical protein